MSPGWLIALDGVAAGLYTAAFLWHTSAGGDAAAKAVGMSAWIPWVIAAGIGLPLLVRRRWPVTVFGVVLAVSVVAWWLHLLADPFVAAAYALYTVALTRAAWGFAPTLLIATIGVVAMLGVLATGAPSGSLGSGMVLVPLGVAAMATTWTAGRAVRERHEYAARTVRLLAGRAAARERLRIARELHDIVANSMSLIAVKAGVARHVLQIRPQEAADALGAIEETSRRALVELRHMLGVLRERNDGDGDAWDGARSLVAAPGAVDLRALCERVRSAGVEVDLELRGVEDVPEGLALSVYRIVQEALTNVVRHAGPTRCRVAIRADGEAVHIEVTNDVGEGGGRPPAAPGHGLIGMRERAGLYGGMLEAGPQPDGGFRVRASLPVRPSAGAGL